MAARVTIISDLHLGDHSPADDFWHSGAAPLLLALLEEIAADPAHHLVLLGDVFEQWQFTLDEIFRQNVAVLDAMLALAGEGRLTYVIGNHDYEPFNLYLPAGRLFGVIPLVQELEIPEAGLLAMHGHRQDPHPDRMIPLPGREGTYRVSRRFVYYLKYLERRYPGIDDRLAALGVAAARGWQSAGVVWQALRQLDRGEARSYLRWVEQHLLPWQPPSQSLTRYPGPSRWELSRRDPWEAAALDLLRHRAGRYQTVVMGHTHIPRWVRWGNQTYINSGSWCHTSRYPCTFVRIEPDHPPAALWRVWQDGQGAVRSARWDERLEQGEP